jgi:methionine-rich copper-binding protein CopC
VKNLAPILLAVAASALASVALAHPMPRASSPAPNAVLTSSPPQIQITFSENLVAAFSGLGLTDAAGHKIAVGPAKVDARDRKRLAAPVTASLAPGAYTVSWHAVGDDTHHTSGRYSFTVKP